ncbi:MAG: glutamine-hydrolyzing carbamoyl-phosphate synthase small subunit [Deltaproteobacteria bacterium]|nr:glutamine-hydrolyzing carbamoyl-phosphate synthase small subunit [Deltaproteobacteria bacterium]
MSEVARLVLADGLVLEGEAFGARDTVVGEVVFNTALTGYQEIISDPSYAGQLICFTYPEIGNYGTHAAADEAPAPRARGVIVRNLEREASSWTSEEELDAYLTRHGVVGLSGVDTRKLVRRIRSAGAQMGVLDSTGKSVDALRAQAAAAPGMEGRDLVSEVSTRKRETLPPLTGEQRARVAVIDYGAKGAIVEQLREHGCEVVLLPASVTAGQVLEVGPEGVLLSNGPGDPAVLTHQIETVKGLLGQVPLFGICLGSQLLGLALGARTHKLPFGHHGANHPVLDLETGKVEVTSQNHGFAIDEQSLPEGVVVSHRSLNDETVEGISAPAKNAAGVQYHPEAAPGPHDARHLFERFLGRIEASRA